jgi:hypothetical protein
LQLNLAIRAVNIKGKKVTDPVKNPDQVTKCWLESNEFPSVNNVLQLVGILQTNFNIVNLLRTEIEAINAIVKNQEVGEFFDSNVIFKEFFNKAEKIVQGVNPNED